MKITLFPYIFHSCCNGQRTTDNGQNSPFFRVLVSFRCDQCLLGIT
jgi:hypothetical protein